MFLYRVQMLHYEGGQEVHCDPDQRDGSCLQQLHQDDHYFKMLKG